MTGASPASIYIPVANNMWVRSVFHFRMDITLHVLLFIALAGLFGHTDAGSTASTVKVTAATTKTPPAAAAATTVGKASITAAKTTTTAPLTCWSGTCNGDQCKNNSYTYTTLTCKSGECFTKENKNKGIYTFGCPSTNCAAEKKAAPNDTRIICCNTAKCNTYAAAQSDASTMYTSSFTVFIGLMWCLVKFF